MIPVLFNTLLINLPLVFFKNTSELFEFNKIVVIYIFTVLIIASWIIKSIKAKKFIFSRTILDWPFTIYLLILFISTLFSIEPRTSVLGYYSRFNGGLMSQISYILLTWAFISNLDQKQKLTSLKFILIGGIISAILGIGEHFGIFTTCGLMKLGFTESCWVQDIQTRVFSTLGQPNWLAALLVTLLPMTYLKSTKFYIVSVIFFVTLIFTGSRSGLFAFVLTSIIYWGLILYKDKLKYLKEFFIINLIFLIIFLVFNPNYLNLKQKTPTLPSSGPALEIGGTESGIIRKYVWLGAFKVFKNYPILGTGPETFAFSFPMFKPAEHNLTSEWDFIYNKAHNEYLNYLANTGILGFLSYISIIIFSLVILVKSKKYDLLAGYIGILITNFFGFSVVPISLLFFLIPGIVVVNKTNYNQVKNSKLNNLQLIFISGIIIFAFLTLILVGRYWLSDVYYNKSKIYYFSNQTSSSLTEIKKAINFSRKEPLYTTQLALITKSPDLINKALNENPYNPNIRKAAISIYAKLSVDNIDHLKVLEKIILDGTKLSPNDPKYYYQLGLFYQDVNFSEAEKYFLKSIELKDNYKDARFYLGKLYLKQKKLEDAKKQFEYILKNIDPKDELTKQYLDDLVKP